MMERLRMFGESLANRVAAVPVKHKMDALLFFLLVLYPLTLLILGQVYDQGVLTNVLVAGFVLAVIFFIPVSRLLSHMLAVRNIRELNAQCRRLKEGKYELGEMPAESGEEHDFLRLRSNLHWMGYAIASRERKLTAAMARLAEAQRQIGDSIDYAGLIQTSFLPAAEELEAAFRDHFLIWNQRDKVGGDAYWFKRFGTGFFVAVIDCTGHGVPGAFLTLIVHSLFERVASTYSGTSPARVLVRMNRLIKESLGQDGSESASDDGMDCGLCYVEPSARRVVFAGANMSMFILEDGRVKRVRGNRCGLGYVRSPVSFEFTDTTFDLNPGTRIFLSTDGITDQIGGPKRLPFGRRRLEEFMRSRAGEPLHHQGRELVRMVEEYRGREPRRDDITVLGFEL